MRDILYVLLMTGAGAGPACQCPDGVNHVDATAPRIAHAAKIDACLASELACEALCREVLALMEADAVTRCVITAVRGDAVDLSVTYVVPHGCGA